MVNIKNTLCSDELQWIKKKDIVTFLFCVGECKIPFNVKGKISFFQNLNVQSRCLISVKLMWINANSRCMQKE